MTLFRYKQIYRIYKNYYEHYLIINGISNYQNLAAKLTNSELITFIDSDGKNVGNEFLQVAEVGKINKVTFKITYPKDTIKKNKSNGDKKKI